MANYMADTLKVKTIYVLDDSGAYGVGLADAFQAQAEKKGIKILGRDRLDPKAADYSAVLTKIKSLDPQALYYGGVGQAAVKLFKQSYDIIPNVIKAGGDGIESADVLKGAGFPACEGWYATVAAPHVTEDPKTASFAKRYNEKFKQAPDDYTITCYVAAQVIIDAVKGAGRRQQDRRPHHHSRRHPEQSRSPNTLLGPIEFDENGDLKNKIISVFKITKNPAKALDDPSEQYKYVGVAPAA